MTRNETSVFDPLDGACMDAITASYEFSMIYNLIKNTFVIRKYSPAFLGEDFPLHGSYDAFIKEAAKRLLKKDTKYPPSVDGSREQLRRYQDGLRHREERCQICDRNGEVHWIRERIVYVEDPASGDILGLLFAAVIDEEVQSERNSRRIGDEPAGVVKRRISASANEEEAAQEPEVLPEFALEDLWSIYEKLGETLYAADMDTYELLYMNKKGREIIGVTSVEDIHGRRCYEVIQGKSSPCEFCTNAQMMCGKPVEYDFFNKKYSMMCHVYDQRIVYHGRNIRIEHVRELNPETDHLKSDRADQIRNAIHESIRMALEEQDANRGIEILLEYLGEVLQAERTYLFELTPDEKAWRNTYEWCAKGVKPEKDALSYVPLEDAALWKREFAKGNHIKIRDVEKIRESDRTVYEYLVPQNIHSLLVAPVYQEEKLYGFVGFDNPPKEMIDLLGEKIQSIAHVLQSMLERRILKEKLDEIIFVDGMTRLGNRHAVERYFEGLDHRESIGVAFCDVCGLKYVNDNLGHLSGDALLLRISGLLREAFPTGELFRWGGDEMMVLICGAEKKSFYQCCEVLKRRSLEENTPIAVGEIWRARADVSHGELIREADKKMYFHKALLYRDYDIYRMLMNNRGII